MGGPEKTSNSCDLNSQFDHVFVLGDFNYRIEYGNSEERTPSRHSFEKVCASIENQEFDYLYQNDQLRIAMEKQQVFVEFQEQKISFKPTFKVLRQPALQYTPQRAPAWCDRVLVRSAKGRPKDTIEPLEYWGAMHVASSDHKPVCATYRLHTCIFQPAYDDSLPNCTMTFSGLKCTNLRNHAIDNKKKSLFRSDKINPVIRFYGSFLKNDEYSTPCIRDNMNPSWPDRCLKPVLLKYNNPNRLDQCTLYIGILNTTISSGSSTLVGSAAINLSQLKIAELFAKQPKKYPLTVRCTAAQLLSYAGLPAGGITGVLSFRWDAKVKRSISRQQSFSF